jgi:2-methylaconitate cis-trans-isomerase PrpF
MAVAARIEGSLVHQLTRAGSDDIRIAMPSGILVVAAAVKKVNGAWHAEQGAFYRTQRRMFDGQVYVRASRVPGMLASTHAERRVA